MGASIQLTTTQPRMGSNPALTDNNWSLDRERTKEQQTRTPVPVGTNYPIILRVGNIGLEGTHMTSPLPTRKIKICATRRSEQRISTHDEEGRMNPGIMGVKEPLPDTGPVKF